MCRKCGTELLHEKQKFCRSCGASVIGQPVVLRSKERPEYLGTIRDDINVKQESSKYGYPRDYLFKLELIENELGNQYIRIPYLRRRVGRDWEWGSKWEPIFWMETFKELIIRGLKEKEWFRNLIIDALEEAGLRK